MSTESITLHTGRGEFKEVNVGDLLSELLVTDTVVWEVVKVTEKTVTVRSTTTGDSLRNDHGSGPYPINHSEAVSDPNGRTKTLRVRKDGSIRVGNHAGVTPLYPTPRINGLPARRVDYSF